MADEKLDTFISIINEDASRESAALEAEIKKRHDSFFETVEDELLAEVYDYIRTTTARIRTEAGRRVSQKTFEQKRELYRHRSEVAKKVVDDARARIIEYTKSEEYPIALEKLAKYAGGKLGGETLCIYLRPEDMRFAPKIEKAAKASVLEGNFSLGGLIAENPERHMRLDLSYDASLEREASSFGTIVANERG